MKLQNRICALVRLEEGKLYLFPRQSFPFNGAFPKGLRFRCVCVFSEAHLWVL